MADRLEELGFMLDREPLRAREAAGNPLGRPHLADAVLEHPGNAEKLAAEGITGKNTLFLPYLVPARSPTSRARGLPWRRRSR